MDFVFLYTIIHVINLLFNDVICIHLSVSLYSIAFIANQLTQLVLFPMKKRKWKLIMHKWIILWTGGRCLLQLSSLSKFWNFQKLQYWNFPILQPKFWWFFCPEKQLVGRREKNIFQMTALLKLVSTPFLAR